MAFFATVFVITALGGVHNAECFLTGSARITKWEKLPELSSYSSDVASRKSVLPPLLKMADEVREDGEVRVPIPGPIPFDTEKLKQIAEILRVIGQQVIPALLGQSKQMGTGEPGKYTITSE